MCLGTVAQVTGLDANQGVQVRVGDRLMAASLLALTEPVQPGDWVLVHSGLVLARLTDQEASDALQLRNATPRESHEPDGAAAFGDSPTSRPGGASSVQAASRARGAT